METKFGNWLHNFLGNKLNNQKSAVFLEILIVFGITLSFIKILMPFANGNQMYQQGIVWLGNILMIFMVWLGQRLRKKDFHDLGLKWPEGGWKSKLKTFLWSFVVFILALSAFILGSVVMSRFSETTTQADMGNYDFLKNNPDILILSMLGVFIVSSFGEEIVYRGFLIDRVLRIADNIKSRKLIAILISASVFGIVHYQWGVTGVVQTTLMGLVLGTCFIVLRKRLLVLVLAHAYMDALLLLSIYFN